MLNLKKPLAFIDIEATGMNVTTDRIVEIAIIKTLPDGARTIKRKLFNPQIPIPQFFFLSYYLQIFFLKTLLHYIFF
jgi:DNA polymerase-3 subunit epsilon